MFITVHCEGMHFTLFHTYTHTLMCMHKCKLFHFHLNVPVKKVIISRTQLIEFHEKFSID